MKLKLDENLGWLGKSLLEADGHDVMTVAEQQLSGASDCHLYGVCRDEGRVLITLDRDFELTLRFPPELTAGIVVLDCRGRLSPRMIASRMAESQHSSESGQSTASFGLWNPAACGFTSAVTRSKVARNLLKVSSTHENHSHPRSHGADRIGHP